MLQKTFHLTDITTERFERVLDEVAVMPEYNGSSQILLIMLEQNWDKDIIREKTGAIKRILPKVQIVGVNHHDDLDSLMGITKSNNSILTFMFFEHPAFTVMRFPFMGMIEPSEDIRAGEQLNEKLVSLKKDLFFLRMQHATNQLDNPVKISLVKKDIARVQTIIREKELEQ